LTIEDQLAAELEALSFETRRSFKAVVNEVLRAGLESKRQKPIPRFREQPVKMGLRREYEGKLNQIADELSVEDFAVKAFRR